MSGELELRNRGWGRLWYGVIIDSVDLYHTSTVPAAATSVSYTRTPAAEGVIF